MWVLFIAIIISILGTLLATYLNRNFFKELKELKERVRAKLSERPDLSIEKQLSSIQLSDVSRKGFLFLVRKIAHIIGVSADKLRLDDRMGDYFIGFDKDNKDDKSVPEIEV